MASFNLVNRRSTKLELALPDWALQERQQPRLLLYKGGFPGAVRVAEDEALVRELRSPRHSASQPLPSYWGLASADALQTGPQEIDPGVL